MSIVLNSDKAASYEADSYRLFAEASFSSFARAPDAAHSTISTATVSSGMVRVFIFIFSDRFQYGSESGP